jgi:transposase, IS5 family
MNQASPGLGNPAKRTHKRKFLAQSECAVPWQVLVALVAPYTPERRRGQPPFAV